MKKLTCDFGHIFEIEKERELEQASRCPNCGALTFNRDAPKRKIVDLDGWVSRAYTDSDSWDPWTPNCGEWNIDERERRKKEGSIRWNPKTKAWSGFFDTRQKYRQWLKDKGVCNGWGEGEINPDKQRWDRSNEEVEKEYRERYREKA